MCDFFTSSLCCNIKGIYLTGVALKTSMGHAGGTFPHGNPVLHLSKPQRAGGQSKALNNTEALNNTGPSIISWGMPLVTGHQWNSATDHSPLSLAAQPVFSPSLCPFI